MSNKTTVVITSINNATEAVKAYSQRDDVDVIVIGDKKSPIDYNCENVNYISVLNQEKQFGELAAVLPYNHYGRKNLGYIAAIKNGADIIFDTDDDNTPKENWYIPHPNGEYLLTQKNLGFVNIYSAFTDEFIWPRGLPLPKVRDPKSHISHNSLSKKDCNIGVWQGLADGDPDVDAIFRLIIQKHINFDDSDPIVLSQGTICPYNSQNTFTFKEFFPLLYLPSHVTFRFTDILRGLIGQCILWEKGAYLGFTQSTVFQDRNEHNLMHDFEDEIPCYMHAEDVINITLSVISSNLSVIDNLLAAYEALIISDIVGKQEQNILDVWAKEF